MVHGTTPRGIMKDILFALIRYSGLPFFFREVLQRNRVTLILFHDISPKNAEKIFGYLKKRYSLIPLQDLLGNYSAGTWNVPKKPMVITFDDGVAGNYALLPLIKKMDIPVTIFLCAGIINTKRHFWFPPHHPDYTFFALRQMSNKRRLSVLQDIGFTPETEFENAQALSKKQIEEMAPYVNFQSHTLFHPFLPTCTAEEAEQEIAGSKHLLEREYGLKINAFSYPNGDFSPRDCELCKKAGYACAISLVPGYNTPYTDLYTLKRVSANDTENLYELAVKASGFWALVRKFLRL
jgi:peptidoglycan/xylan/chitin deacetylase (PgdA/CDA1 family)